MNRDQKHVVALHARREMAHAEATRLCLQADRIGEVVVEIWTSISLRRSRIARTLPSDGEITKA